MNILFFIASCILCGLTYLKFFGGCLGFVPIFGEFFLFRNLSDIHCDYEVKQYYSLSFILSIFFAFMPVVLLFVASGKNDFFFYFTFEGTVVIFTILTFICAIFRLIYTYKIICPFANINLNVESKNMIMLFSVIPVIFYIYVLSKNIETDR